MKREIDLIRVDLLCFGIPITIADSHCCSILLDHQLKEIILSILSFL